MLSLESMKLPNEHGWETDAGFNNCAEPQAVFYLIERQTQIRQGQDDNSLKAFIIDVVAMMVEQDFEGARDTSGIKQTN